MRWPVLHPVLSYQRARSFADLHFYQKWHAVWPRLAQWPETGVRVLDAGCGDGQWSLEIGSRRPGWTVVGLDRDSHALARARQRHEKLALRNVSFQENEFEAFMPDRPFDVVISICSAHYGQTRLGCEPLFRRIAEWLGPHGRFLALVPRSLKEAPFVKRLARPDWYQLFTREDLESLCASGGMVAEQIEPCVGRIGTFAKQLDWSRSALIRPAGQAASVIARSIGFVDARVSPSSPDQSLLWLLTARRAEQA